MTIWQYIMVWGIVGELAAYILCFNRIVDAILAVQKNHGISRFTTRQLAGFLLTIFLFWPIFAIIALIHGDKT